MGTWRMLGLLKDGIPAEGKLVLTPQRTLATPYYKALQDTVLTPGGQINLLTIGGLARRMIDLFWPLSVEYGGFSLPDQPPIFLTLETAQYHMAHIVRPVLDEGFFDSVCFLLTIPLIFSKYLFRLMLCSI